MPWRAAWILAHQACRTARSDLRRTWRSGISIRYTCPIMERIEKLRLELMQFADERDWDQFHNPKNLAMALIAEAGELVEHFQWLTPHQAKNLSEETKSEVEQEIADVFLYLMRLADKLGIDMIAAAEKKMQINAEKYPIEKSKGMAIKYNKL
jgi:dCTP diphosphatase